MFISIIRTFYDQNGRIYEEAVKLSIQLILTHIVDHVQNLTQGIHVGILSFPSPRLAAVLDLII